jgi:hypothetical protein
VKNRGILSEILSSPVRFTIGDLATSEQWLLEQDITKHLVDIISISGYYDDEEPIPSTNKHDITSYEQALLQRKYSFGPSKTRKMTKQSPGAKDGSSGITTIQGNGICVHHYFLIPPLLVHVLLQVNMGSSFYPSHFDLFFPSSI